LAKDARRVSLELAQGHNVLCVLHSLHRWVSKEV
jgi:hypothetical protein